MKYVAHICQSTADCRETCVAMQAFQRSSFQCFFMLWLQWEHHIYIYIYIYIYNVTRLAAVETDMQLVAAAGSGSGAVAVAAAAWRYANKDPQTLQPRMFSNAKSKSNGKHRLIATVSSLLPNICLYCLNNVIISHTFSIFLEKYQYEFCFIAFLHFSFFLL